jgi:hypothetical protein
MNAIFYHARARYKLERGVVGITFAFWRFPGKFAIDPQIDDFPSEVTNSNDQ